MGYNLTFLGILKKFLTEVFNIQFVRILILMLFAAFLVYMISPKYQSAYGSGYLVRFNKITGTRKVLDDEQGRYKWVK